MMILKILGPEVSIAANTTVSDATLIRVINTGALAVCNVGTTGNVSVSNTQYVVIEKAATDNVKGANMLAVPVAYKY